jgi:hypothetical protein
MTHHPQLVSVVSRSLRLSSPLQALVGMVGLSLLACGGTPNGTGPQAVGQSDFESRPANTAQNAGNKGTMATGATNDAAIPGSASTQATTPTRSVEETDLYRLDGNNLYYLNSYRGLMVFDVTNVDAPKLLGRSPIYGDPIEMVVRNGIASVVVSDWYGQSVDGTPFHGSIVRGIDARDPTQMKIVGEAQLGGWVRDTRVVGDVLYAVTEQYPYDAVWYGDGVSVGSNTGVAVSSSSGATVAVTSVNFATGAIARVDRYEASGEGGIFNVTPNSILLASNELGAADQYGYRPTTGRTKLQFLDISDPAGAIEVRGQAIVAGSIQGWSADNGRWNIDFADGKTAHAVALTGQYWGDGSPLVLSTVDFTNPDAPVQRSALTIPATSWSPTARFDTGRMYLSPSQSGCYSYSGGTQPATPIEVFDLSDPSAPRLVGSTDITGAVWLFMPAGNRLFALGNECNTTGDGGYGSNVSLRYLDVTDPAAPRVIGTASFGQGWAWTPAAGTFKAFTKNDAEGLVVLPFSGWDSTSYQYNNGLQLIEFTPSSIATSGTAKTKGWVERGIFVKNRLVSLSDLSLAVVDYSTHAQPTLVTELTLARNVVDVKPQGTTVAELSSDWWDNDQQHSTLRVLPVAQAEENVSGSALAEIDIDGYNASVAHNGNFSYVISNVRQTVPCTDGARTAPTKDGTDGTCSAWTQEIQVIDRADGGAALRGKVALPNVGNYWYGGWGWYGCYAWDWFGGADFVQVDGDALVFRRWIPQYASDGTYLDASTQLYVVDLSNPDQPSIASTTITDDTTSWWGNLRAVGSELYASHYEWVTQPKYEGNTYDPGVVRYYLDKIDLTDRAHPSVGAKINVPGILVGADETDPSIVYTMDYQWFGDHAQNRFEVLKLKGDKAYLQGWLDIPGWVGNTFVRGSTAYFSVQVYDSTTSTSSVSLYQLDLSNPSKPVLLPSLPAKGWGWLMDIQGDRAFVTSGWGNVGIDVFRLAAGKAPTFDRFIRARGWWTNSLARQGNQLFLASGYWGTEVVNLQ